MNFILIEGKILPKVDKGSWFNQLSGSEATSASSLNISAVSKKKIMVSRRKQCYERGTSKNESGKRSADYSLSSDSSLCETNASLHF